MDVPQWHERDDARASDPERVVRIHVHIALASIFLTLLAPVVSWTLWLFDRRLPGHTWKRRLLALAIVDTVLICGLGLSSALGVDLERAATKAPKIGVVLETRDEVGRLGQEGPRGAVIERVVPNGPAASAGLEPRDRVVAVDGTFIDRSHDLIAALAETREGHSRRLEIVRDGQRLERVVTPTTKPMPSARASTPLFEPVETEQELGRRSGRRYAVPAGLFEVLLMGMLAIAAKRRRASAAPAFGVLAGLIALTAVSSGVLLVFMATIGVSLGAMLVAILSGSVALLVVGLVVARLMVGEPLQVGFRIGTPKAISLGMLYGVTGAARIAILLTMLVAVLGVPLRTASEAFGLDWSWGLGGIGLFLLATVVVAPVAEEVVFRGVLLPWLARWMRPGPALAWTTIVFAFGHLYYGAGVLLISLYGLVFGWARLRTGNLLAPIILHAALNGATAAALLATS